MSRSNRRTAKQGLAVIGVVLVACLAAPVFADDESAPRVNTRFTDSSDERTPAITAIPTYPKIARRDRIEGDATVCFRIDMDGHIRSVRVKSYTDRIFRRPAIRAIKDSSFMPLEPDEQLSTSRVCRTYRFRLEPIVADADDPSSG